MISQNEIDIILRIMQPYKPVKVGVFGSYARGENREDSDIDILYQFDSKYSLFDLAGLQIELETQLSKDVDLVEFNAIHPLLKNRILNDAKIIYAQ